MIAVTSEEQYRRLRGSRTQKIRVKKARDGQPIFWGKNSDGSVRWVEAKTKLEQFNYSCLPNEDGTLAGSTRLSNSVGMDIDLERGADESQEQFQARLEEIPTRVLAKKDELGLQMLERSATKGYHLVFTRRLDLNQEENLIWASQLLGVKFDDNAKDITRVFFTTTDSAEDLLFLSKDLFVNEGVQAKEESPAEGEADNVHFSEQQGNRNVLLGKAVILTCSAPRDYVVKALEEQLGGAPVHGSRNNFIFAMACHLIHLYGNAPATISLLVPQYGERTERWRSTIESACRTAKSAQVPDVLKRAIKVAEARYQLTSEATAAGGNTDNAAPALPEQLPPLIAHLTSKVPDI